MARFLTNTITARLRLNNLTLKDWAEANNYRPDTVYKTVYGKRGKTGLGASAKIICQLKSEGYWPADTEDATASPSVPTPPQE